MMKTRTKTARVSLLFAAVLCAATAPALAQPDATSGLPASLGALTGRVYDAASLQPLAATNVTLVGTNRGAASDVSGLFRIERLPAGMYSLLVERIGYAPFLADSVQIVAGSVASFAVPLFETEVRAQEVVVTATRREQTAQMAPASVTVLGRKEMRHVPVRTFDQVLETVPGLTIHRSGGISVSSLSIRGSSDVAGGGVGNRVLLTIDGRPALTADTGGALWSLVPRSMVDRVEVVKGAFSSLYGSTAMGGVVNVITRRPAYRARTTIQLNTGFFEQRPANERFSDDLLRFQSLNVGHSGRRGALSYLIDVGTNQSDGHRENSGYTFTNVYAKLLYDFSANRNLELSLGGTRADNDFPHTWENRLRPLRVQPRWRDDRQEKRAYSADVYYWAIPDSRLKYSSRFYFYRNRARSFFNEDDQDWLRTGNAPLGLSTAVRADKWGNLTQIDFVPGGSHAMIAGLDAQVDQVFSTPDSIMYGDRQVNNVALYAQDEFRAFQNLTATIGLRYDYNTLVGGIAQSRLSPKLAAVYTPTPSIAIRALFGQAFRAPSIAERFFQEELNGGTLFKPNPQLRAEKMQFSLEAGLRYNPSRSVELDLAWFRYQYTDMIYWEEISAEEGVIYTLFQVRNLQRARLQGAEASLRVTLGPALRAGLQYVYTDAVNQSPGRVSDTLPYRIRHAISGSIAASVRRVDLAFSGRYQSRVEEVFLYPLDAPESWFVAQAKLRYRFTPGISAHVSARNLFNARYEELARYRMPGRSWSIGLDFAM